MRQFLFRISVGRRYAILLAALISTMLIAVPMSLRYHGELTVGVFVTWLILSGLLVAGQKRAVRSLALMMLALSAPTELALRLGYGSGLMLFASILNALIIGLTIGVILHRLLHATRVTTDTFLGGVCVYLLIGFGFFFLFNSIEQVGRGAFLEKGALLEDLGSPDREIGRYHGLVYFSFVTLTTLGYGDIEPVNDFARMLAVFEAIVGQIYLSALVAIFFGLHIGQKTGEVVSPGHVEDLRKADAAAAVEG
ncbi:MAG: potassium channel family protein [Thermoleophilia bacterium]|nr:potassium channel family protein [Thermoleophilia bacterium]